jgi:hypothetical protein
MNVFRGGIPRIEIFHIERSLGEKNFLHERNIGEETHRQKIFAPRITRYLVKQRRETNNFQRGGVTTPRKIFI